MNYRVHAKKRSDIVCFFVAKAPFYCILPSLKYVSAMVLWGRSGFDGDVLGFDCSGVMSFNIEKQ